MLREIEPSASKIVLKTSGILLFWLVLAVIAGVVACLLFDVAPLRRKSDALPYAIWFVIGAFTGIFAFSGAAESLSGEGKGEWGTRPGARRIANLILATSLASLVGLGLFFHAIWWSQGVDGEFFVPDSAPHTIIFFVTVFLTMLLGRHLFVEERKTLP